MARLFGQSMRNIASNSGLHAEETEKFPFESMSTIENNETGVFLKPRLPKSVNYGNLGMKPRLFSQNIDTTETYEEISKINIEANDYQDISAPSSTTTSSSFQQIRVSNMLPPRQSIVSDMGYNRSQNDRIFCPAPRKPLINSRLQFKGHGSNTERNQADTFAVPRNFDLGMNNSVLSHGVFKSNNSLASSENYNSKEKTISLNNVKKLSSNLAFRNSSAFARMLSSGSRTNLEKPPLQYNNNPRIHSLSSFENFANKNFRNMPATTLREDKMSSFFADANAGDETRFSNSKKYDSTCFVRPSLSKLIRPRPSTMSSQLFSHCTGETNMSSRFNATHIPQQYDTFSESRLISLKSNQTDTKSLTGISVINVDLAMDILENLHHTMLNWSSNIPVEVIRREIDHAKEMIENRSEISFAHTIKDIDSASITSYSSKCTVPFPLSKQTEKQLDTSVKAPLKSAQDILKGLISKSSKNKDNTLLPSIQEERISSKNQTKEIQWSDEEREDSALLFKKPKPYFYARKKQSNALKIKTPQVQKNVISKESSKQVINLKKWYPVAAGKNLVFCGTMENGTSKETEAVKKRLDNRKVILINGLECNLIGSPSEKIFSDFPKAVALKLKDGLISHWRMFQRELSAYQNRNGQRRSPKERGKKNERKSISSNSPKGKKPKKPKEEEEMAAATYETTPKRRRKLDSAASEETTKNKRKDSAAAAAAVVVSKKKNSRKSTPVNNNNKKKKKKKTNGSGKSNMAVRQSNADVVEDVKLSSSVEEEDRKKRRKVSPAKPSSETPVNGSASSSQKNTGEHGSRTRSGTVYGYAGGSAGGSAAARKDDFPSSMETPKGVLNGRQSSKKNSNSNSKKASPSSTAQQRQRQQQQQQKNAELSEQICSSTVEGKKRLKVRNTPRQRKRRISAEGDSTERKRTKLEDLPLTKANSSAGASKKSYASSHSKQNKKRRESKSLVVSSDAPKPASKTLQSKIKSSEKNRKKTFDHKEKSVKSTSGCHSELEEDFDLQLDDIEIPEVANLSGKLKLNRSQLRLVCSETPPLKYFNSNLKLLKNVTPVSSPNWCISQRTESEVKQFQKRRAIAQKKKIVIQETKTKVTKVRTAAAAAGGKNRDVKNVLDWVADVGVTTPAGNSKILKYMIPSRKKMETMVRNNCDEEDEEEEEEEEEEEGKVNAEAFEA